jgi:small-conductance mechanosensitive channel
MNTILHHLGLDISGEWSELIRLTMHIVIILAMAWLLLVGSHKLIRTLRIYLSKRTRDQGSIKRAETLGRAARNTASVVITLVAGMLILGEFGISIAPILAAAGVAGVAIGFGAQSLIKDYFNGFFLLIEDQIRKGEVVEAGGKSGLVEDVTLRHVVLRDYEGCVHFVPNGVITTVTNMSRDYSYARVDIGVAYREDVDEVYDVMRRVGAGMRSDPALQDKILDDLEIAGVDEWAESSVVIRCRFKVMPLEQWGIRREFLYRLKKAFDLAGIEIPFPHVTLYAGMGKKGEAPPFPIQDAGKAPAGT